MGDYTMTKKFHEDGLGLIHRPHIHSPLNVGVPRYSKPDAAMATLHALVWDSTTEGISVNRRPAKAAYVDGKAVFISAGAVERGELPPGFQRLLTEAECQSEGVTEAMAVSAGKVLPE
jgi:hypothetical protein